MNSQHDNLSRGSPRLMTSDRQILYPQLPPPLGTSGWRNVTESAIACHTTLTTAGERLSGSQWVVATVGVCLHIAPAAVSARTLRESCLPGRCGPRAAPIIETRRDLNPRDRRKLGEKPRQALRKRKAQAPCERRPSRVRIHIAAWFHRP